jgi:serine/threonine protein kinase
MVGQHVGKYKVLARVGRGGMGTVYRAADETLQRDVALKILNTDVNDPAVGRRFQAEAVAIARLNHPGIATIFELFEDDGRWLMAMEFVRGENLEDLIARAGALPVDRAADLVTQALLALAHAHGMGVVHRDLKPANLMLSEAGRIKIMDFGIARIAGSEHLTSAGLRMGTPAYMSPEQVMGHEIDARTDVYAMGCVLYFLLTAKLPFGGESALDQAQARLKDEPTPIRMVRGDVPDWMVDVLARAMARDAGGRFQTADTFREALRRGAAGLPLDAPAATTPVATETGSIREPTASSGALPLLALPTPDGQDDEATRILSSAAMRAGATASTMPIPPSTPPATKTINRRTMYWIGAASAAAAALVATIWIQSHRRTAPVPEPAPPPPVAAAPEPAPVPTPVVPAPPAAPPPPSTGAPAVAPTPTAPGPTARGRRGASASDPAIEFTGIKLLRVTGRRGEDVDAVLQLGNGLLAVAPRRGDAVSAAYKDVLAATFVKDRDPRWAPNLATPPPNLDLPAGFLGRRSARNWLTLQGGAWYLIVSLTDEQVEPVLAAIAERTRVKIDRPVR